MVPTEIVTLDPARVMGGLNEYERRHAITSRTLVGYMYGGILSTGPHSTHGDPTYASSMAIPIYITPKASTCTIAAEPVE